MVDTGDSSSSANEVKSVVVRVKRKDFQSPLEAFWLEINERPLKRPLLDFGKLSLNCSSGKETVSSSDATVDILQSFVPGSSSDSSEVRTKVVERKLIFKEGIHLYIFCLDSSKQDRARRNPDKSTRVQVNEDDDFYDGPMQFDYESDDSNAKDNPLNEYPDEETSEDEDDGGKSKTFCEEFEIGSSDDQSDELQDKPYDNLGYEFGNEDLLYEEEVSGDDDYDGDGGHDCI
ncbi:hypothetical protein IFM89_032530 [Coptis chinensis]|uniref:Transcription factor Iwr1 domain-containing protein n=1 Tax=Coptis chinensis TaxID=261450 RepID=A0A835MG93_9MAGN|nr:hypothetical protein IFM89_032530 [Coptis chinensis]